MIKYNSRFKTIIDKLIYNYYINSHILGYFSIEFNNIIVKDNSSFIAKTDGNIIKFNENEILKLYNENFKETKLLEQKFVGFLYIHEIHHLYLSHFLRLKNRDVTLWNMATDIEINELIKKHYPEYYNPIMENIFCFSNMSPEIKPYMIAEEIYEILKQTNKTQNKITIDMDIEKDDKQIHNKNNSKKNIKEINKIIDILEDKINNTNMMSKIKSLESQNIYNNIYYRRDKNLIKLNKILYHIKKIDSGLGNKRFMSSFIKKNILINKLPGHFKNKKQINYLSIIIDESGSMDTYEIEYLLSGIINFINKKSINIKHLFIIQHDVEVSISESKNIKRINLSRSFMGGTSHKKVFDTLKELNKKNNIEVNIFLTDGYSDIDKYDWNKIKGLKLWVFNNNDINIKSFKKSYVIRVKEK